MTWWFVRTDVDGEFERTDRLAYLLVRRTHAFGKRKACSGVESSKG